ITSPGNRKPANANLGGSTGRTRQLRHMRLSMPNDVFPLCNSPHNDPGSILRTYTHLSHPAKSASA
ncbi:MAG: hypothetical protein QOG18_1148, partial [Microbacteriaceae bacterium]|nr:hypothetical protein [Microbacteriaceae bacterium]